MFINTFMELFGYEISKKVKEEGKPIVTPIPTYDDTEVTDTVTTGSSGWGSAAGFIKINETETGISDHELILRYREISEIPEVDNAITDIVDGAISSADNNAPVDLVLDQLDMPETIKEKILDEFKTVLGLYKFNRKGYKYFRDWYIDSRIYFQILPNENSKSGIKELRLIDPLKIKKIKEVEKKTDPKTKVDYEVVVKEYYIYSPAGFTKESSGRDNNNNFDTAVKLDSESVISVNSGLFDKNKKKIIGYLNKVLKIVNQLNFLENALVVYRVSRAPERRIFYIDVGNLPTKKAEEYIQSVISRYRNKLTYDVSTGEIHDSTRHMSMLEDFYLPRKEGGRGTEISTLPGGENLGQIEDILYFQKKLHRALNVPVSRMEADSSFSLGRSTEITRDEVKLQKFIDKLRKQFSQIFMGALRIQLILKKIIKKSEWQEIEDAIGFDYVEDNYFAELKEFEILRERMEMLQTVSEYVGKYYSNSWVRKKILRQSDEDIKNIDKEIETESKSGEIDDDEDIDIDIEPKKKPDAKPEKKPDDEKDAEDSDIDV